MMEKVGYLSKIDACSVMAKKVNEIVAWINEHEQARGSMTQNENADI